jgi:hypothetical protein
MDDEQDAITTVSRLTDADMPGYEMLTQAVLAQAVARRFASGYTDGDVVRFVARARAGTPVRDEDMALDPLAAETTLRRALGQDVPAVKDPMTRNRCVMALLTITISELELEEQGAGALLAEARARADQWLSAMRVVLYRNRAQLPVRSDWKGPANHGDLRAGTWRWRRRLVLASGRGGAASPGAPYDRAGPAMRQPGGEPG